MGAINYRQLFVGSLAFNFLLCSCKDTITKNQTFQDSELLISRENNFALGFFSPGNSKFRYVGIWFYQVREQTVVWVANRDSPINGPFGVLSISIHGNLNLYSNHSQKVPSWSTSSSVDQVTGACVVQLLDSGNLVLLEDRSKRVLWQSFDYPTDTLLQGMKFGIDWRTGARRFLSSWRSEDDPGTGEYSMELNPKGSPQAFLCRGRGRDCFWRGTPWPLRRFVDVMTFDFVNNQDEAYLSFVVEASIIARAKLDLSGVHKHLIWDESNVHWKEIRSAPKYKCDEYGRCGSYGKCDPGIVNRGFECSCLPGYEPKSPGDWHTLRDGSGGCVRKRIRSLSACGDGEGFVGVENVKLPDTRGAIWVSMSMNHMECEKECKKNCSCTAYSSIDIPGEGIGCLAWYGELNDTVDYPNEGYDLHVRVDAIEFANENRKSRSFVELEPKTILLLSIVSAWIVLIFFAFIWLKKKRKKVKWNKRWLDAISESHNHMDAPVGNEVGVSRSHPDVALFSLGTLVAATNNFSPANKLGQGGFGSVYKGCLTNGLDVAVKRLSEDSKQGIDEFKNEVTLIAKLQHVNLVKLLGCCIEGEEPMLIYEYLPNKSLDSFLFDETRRCILNWTKRFQIIVGIACGILYLHEHSRLRIIHRDLKTSNILLDSDMNPKIADFGTARILTSGQIQERTKRIVGTYGYMSPEYVVFGKFSAKSDVFSYGVILLEIITGKKNNGHNLEDSSITMLEHVWEMWKEDRALETVDESVKELSFDVDQVLRCIQVGLLCVQKDAMHRPNIAQVALMLNSDQATLPSPNQPAFSYRKPDKLEQGTYSVNDVTITSISSR